MIKVKVTFASGAIRSIKAASSDAATKKLGKYVGSLGEIVAVETKGATA
jgi:hypothetical protein